MIMFPTKNPLPEDGPQVVTPENFDAAAFVTTKIAEVNRLRYGIERVWYRNILFYVGKQWIRYDDKKRTWTRPNLPEWMPTPITNKFASCCDIISSVYSEVKPEIVFSPASGQDADVQTAKVANAVCDICEDESGFKDLEDKLNTWVAITGNVFIYTWYDMNPKHGVTQFPIYACPACGFQETADKFGEGGQMSCPQCQNPEIQSTQETRDIPVGKIVTEVVPPFEIYTDLQVEELKDQPYVLRCSTLPLATIRQRWGDKAKDVKAQGASGMLGQFYYQSLAYITNTTDSGFGSGTEYGGGLQAERATVWEVLIPASAEFPTGYHGFVCDKLELDGGPLEYHNAKGQPVFLLIHIKAHNTPKRFFAKAPVDDLIHKQIQRNKLEAFIQLASQRMANPVWMLPNSCGVETISGEPGEVVRYNDSNTAMAKPERVAGVELTQSTFRWLEKIDRDFEDLASTYDILKGSMPSNVPTLGGLELLKERALSRFTPTIKNIERARVALANHWLWVFKEYGSDPRKKVIKEANGQWAQECFTNADLTGDVDIKSEPGSAAPRSSAYKQFIAGQLMQNQLLDLNDPFTRIEVLRTYHADNFAKSLSEDISDANREEGRFVSETDPQDPVLRPDVDNHQLHVASHIRFAKTDQFRSLPPERQQVFMEHLMTHKQTLVIQMQNLQTMQNGSQPVASGAPVVPPAPPAAAGPQSVGGEGL